MFRLRKAAFKKWQFSKKVEDYVNFKKNAAIAKRTFKTKKRESFRLFAKKINIQTSRSYVWNTVKVLKNKWTKINENFSKEGKEKLITEALEKVAPPWVPNNPDYMPNVNSNEFLSEPFQFTEFNVALEEKNKNSSPGMDGIDYQILQLLPIKYKLILLDIYNEMYTSGNYPTEWKEQYIHFIKNLME